MAKKRNSPTVVDTPAVDPTVADVNDEPTVDPTINTLADVEADEVAADESTGTEGDDNSAEASGTEEQPESETAPEEETPAPAPEPEVQEPTVTEPVVADAPADDSLFPANVTIDTQLKLSLDALQNSSIRMIDDIVKARYSVYNNIFTAFSLYPDEVVADFIPRLLKAIHARKNVCNGDRALVGFMNLTKLTRDQNRMYTVIWKLLVDLADPTSRRLNATNVQWAYINQALSTHKQGDAIYRRLFNALSK